MDTCTWYVKFRIVEKAMMMVPDSRCRDHHSCCGLRLYDLVHGHTETNDCGVRLRGYETEQQKESYLEPLCRDEPRKNEVWDS